MGVVYRVRHRIWNEEKALKMMLGAGSGPSAKRLLDEALFLRQLKHPHIVRVEDVDYTEDDQPFVVMEYVVGQSLGQKLKDTKTLDPETAFRVAAETCSALSAAHQNGIIHRDIKPQNLLLAEAADGSETVKVIDFGIAKVCEEAGIGLSGLKTETGLFVGTAAYASPEQASGMRGRDLDGRTDLYSLGLVLYEMLTGRLPFAGDTPIAVLVQRLHVQPLPPHRLRPELNISPEASGVVMKALEKERDRRFESAERMEDAIRSAMRGRLTQKQRPSMAETVKIDRSQAKHVDSSNPFDPWTPAIPPAFVGRVSVLARLQDALDAGRSISVVGDRRIGKSSLLKTCMTRLEAASRPARLLSGEGREGTSPAVFVECATGVFGGDSPDAAADVLSGWARKAYQQNLPPVLLVDEFDALVVRFEPRFLERLRGMLDYLCLVVSSRREIDRLYGDLGRTSPFVNRLELCWLGLIELEAADELTQRSAAALPSGAQALVREWAGRHPFFIQLFGRKLCDSLRYGEGIESAREQFVTEGCGRLRSLWGTLSEKDRKVLQVAAETPQPQARNLRQRGLLTEEGRPFGRLLVEWMAEGCS